MLTIILNTKWIFLILFLIIPTVIFTQQDTTTVSKTLTSIKDSTVTSDSTKLNVARKPYFLKLKESSFSTPLSTFKIKKKQIDRFDYRYTGEVLNYLPFSFLNNLGYTGQPSEPSVFSNGFGNISVMKGNLLLNNGWNNSLDMNLVQTEGISELSIIPIHRSFLYGISNNQTVLLINSGDTLKSKPISRIRYFQASNEEGYIDAFFSAKILPKTALTIRVTNSSIDENYSGTEYGAWKVNTGITYKLSDSLFAQLNYDHVKLNTHLFGGIDLDKLQASTSDLTNNLYSSDAAVLFESMSNEATKHQLGANVFGKIFPFGNSRLTVNYNFSKDRFSNKINDTTNISNNNIYKTASFRFEQNIIFGESSSSISAGIDNIEYDIDALNLGTTKTNYFISGITSYKLINGMLQPTIFGKYSELNNQTNSGFGFDLKFIFFNKFHLLLGASNFDKPLSIIEEPFYESNIDQSYTSSFASLEYLTEGIKSSFSYFISKGENVPLAVVNYINEEESISEIVFNSTTNPTISGINFNSGLEMWNILLNTNFNYYWHSKNTESVAESKYNLTAGIYYVDTLFNSNLDLKAGFTFFLFDNPTYKVYDFQNMRGSSFYMNHNVVTPLSFTDLPNDKYRLDLLVSGRIQDAATFFLVYENILGNNNYIVPYYPMPEGGMKIGLSWDFLD